MVDVDVVSVGVPNLVLLQQAGEGCDSVTCSRRLLRCWPRWSQLRCWAIATTLATVVTWTWGWSDHDRRGSGPKQLSHHHNNKQPHCGIQQTEGKLVKESSQQS